jgi:hypothetical protein
MKTPERFRNDELRKSIGVTAQSFFQTRAGEPGASSGFILQNQTHTSPIWSGRAALLRTADCADMVIGSSIGRAGPRERALARDVPTRA